MSDHEEAHDRAAAMSEVEALELAIVALRSHEREAKSDIVSLLERGAHASYIETHARLTGQVSSGATASRGDVGNETGGG